MTQVAEGVKATPVAVKLAAGVGVDVPIAQEVHGVLKGEATVMDAYRGLTRKAPGHEIHGEGW
jgi:glycerol-3-phosphate dehydrogenase (NAD(P)+)